MTDMTGNGNYSKDPLDLARSQMDFARMAQDAPSAKQILFKAQTIIPAAPSKPLWKKGAPVAGAALAAGLLFAPVIPESSSLDRVTVNFEAAMPRTEAQQISFDVRNGLDSDILMGSHFSTTDESTGSGMLTLNFTAAGEPRLYTSVTGSVMDAAPDRSPLFGMLVNEARQSERASIVERATSMFSKDQAVFTYIDAENRTAAELLGNPGLLRQALDARLEHEGYSIASLEFIDRAPLPASEDDFRVIELAAWPRPIRLTVDAVDMASFENEEIRRVCEAWLDSVNLGDSVNGLADRPGELLPIMVEVHTPDGVFDRALTERLQALVVQPEGGEITDTSTWDVRTAVEEPLRELMGDRLCAVAYERVADPAYNRDVNFFWVHVKMLNQFEKQQDVDERVEELEQSIDF